MKITLHRERSVLQLALRAAVANHRPDTVHNLLAAQGRVRFAQALAALPARIADDALSLLAPEERRAVRHLLPAHGISFIRSVPQKLLSRMRDAAHARHASGTAR